MAIYAVCMCYLQLCTHLFKTMSTFCNINSCTSNKQQSNWYFCISIIHNIWLIICLHERFDFHKKQNDDISIKHSIVYNWKTKLIVSVKIEGPSSSKMTSDIFFLLFLNVFRLIHNWQALISMFFPHSI